MRDTIRGRWWFRRLLNGLAGGSRNDPRKLSRSAAKLIARGDKARDVRQWSEAAAAYGAALKLSPGIHPIWVQYGHALKECGNVNSAREAYENAIALAPEDPDAILHCAHLLKRQESARAIEMFERLYALTHDRDAELELVSLRQAEAPSQVAQTVPAVPAVQTNNVQTYPKPGLYRELRSVRYVATNLSSATTGHKLRLYVDGQETWTGVVPARARPNGQQTSVVDIRLSFPDPKIPTFERIVRVESATLGLNPSHAEVIIDYAARFSGTVVSLTRNFMRLEAQVRFSDRTGLTMDPFVRVETLAGASLPSRTLSQKRKVGANGQVEFDCLVSADLNEDTQYEELNFFPMWSTVPLTQPALKTNDESVERLVEETDFETGTNNVSVKLDFVRKGFVGGWAKLSETNEARIVVDILCNGEPFASSVANCLRNDLKQALKTSGLHGFEIELPPGLPEGAPVAVRARTPEGTLSKESLPVPPATSGRRMFSPEPEGLLASCRADVSGSFYEGTDTPGVTAIILNRNGAERLRDLFDSVVRTNTFNSLAFIVIDNASSDDLAQVCASYADELRIRFVSLDYCESFSAANNLGARLSESELLLFLGSEAVFVEDMLARLASHFVEPSVGAVGLRLFDTWSPYLDLLVPEPVDRHLGMFFEPNSGLPRMNEMKRTPYTAGISREAIQVPAVAGAALMMRRDDFERIGGFDERLFCGQEDVDLCLRIGAYGLRILCDNAVSLAYQRSFSSPAGSNALARAQVRNREVIELKHTRFVRRLFRSNLLDRAPLTGVPVQIGFVVTENRDATLAGDFFTARELAEAMSRELPQAEFRFIQPEKNGKIDLSGIDVAIIMRDDFSPQTFANQSLTCHIVYWVRNWFDRFLESEHWHHADDVWCSSLTECRKFERVTGRAARFLPIATNWKKFSEASSDADYASDYCFTGSNWGVRREIQQNVLPDTINAKFKVFGNGWGGDRTLKQYWFGALPYSEMPHVYASTRIVVDDANHVTVETGSVNSRVFDAIAAGALPLTNGALGSQEIFGGVLPVYSTSQELRLLLETYLGHEEQRKSKVAQLQQIVMDRHTYEHRARDAILYLREKEEKLPSIAIKIAVPNRAERDEWGDYHFGEALRRDLDRQGHRTGLFYLNEWDSPLAAAADVCLVIRGLNRAALSPHQVNLLWAISHPDQISAHEYRSYDHVLVASEPLANGLRARGIDATAALQCTDTDRFRPDLSRSQMPRRFSSLAIHGASGGRSPAMPSRPA